MTSKNPESISMGRYKTDMSSVSQQGASCEDPTTDPSFGKEDGGGVTGQPPILGHPEQVPFLLLPGGLSEAARRGLQLVREKSIPWGSLLLTLFADREPLPPRSSSRAFLPVTITLFNLDECGYLRSIILIFPV